MATKQATMEDGSLQPFEKAPIYKHAKRVLCNAQIIVAHMPNRHKYVKHTLRVRWYVRYVDDAVLLSHDRDQLYAWRDAIDTWLRVNRKLHLHPNKVKIQPAKQGIDFVGRYILPFRSYPRKMTVHSAKKALADLRKRPMDRGSFDRCQSYLGIMRHTNSFNTRKRLCEAARIPLTIGHNASMTKITNLQ